MKKIRLMPLVAGLVFLLGGCASVAHIEKDDSVNFDNYKTFSWVEDEDAGSSKFLNDIQASNLQQAVNTELEKQNWREEKTKPDVILKHDVLVEKSVRETRNPVYSQPTSRMVYNRYARRWVTINYPSQFLGYENNSYQTKEGKITITMIDAKTDKVVWQGWTTEDVGRDLTSKDIKSGVKSIFKKF